MYGTSTKSQRDTLLWSRHRQAFTDRPTRSCRSLPPADLIIDGTSFRRLPDRLDPNRAKNNSTPSSSGVVSSTPVHGNGVSSSARTNSYNYSNGHYDSSGPSSRENSFSPWPCSRCTLVNEKPLAPICEACGAPKPDYICALPPITGAVREDRQRHSTPTRLTTPLSLCRVWSVS